MNAPGATYDKGVWAPGVYNSFLREITKAPGAVTGGVFVGRFTGGLRVEGLVSTVDEGRSSAVVLDKNTWKWVGDVWSEFYSSQSLVGWYCSRPGLGAVPTERDVQTHLKYFQNNQSILVCVDPELGLMVGYLITENGAPIEVVRGEMDASAIPGTRALGSGKGDEVNLLPWAIGAGVVLGFLGFLVTGSTGWPFA